MQDKLIIDKELKTIYSNLGMNLNSIHFKRQYLAGNLDLDGISDNYINDIRKYYKQFTNRKINLKNHIVLKNLTSVEDVRIIPREVLRQDLIPFFNDIGMINTYTDKNFYDILFPQFNKPRTVLKNVRGQFFTDKNKHLSLKDAKKILFNNDSEYIIKSSDIENGKSIKKIKIDGNQIIMDNYPYSFHEIVEQYKSNFIIQTIIKQHPMLAKLHPSSVNTLRIVTLRWNNEIKHIYTFCRFGVDGDIKDNAGQGGIVIGIDDNGNFMGKGSNRVKKFDKHPTTLVKISELGQVPNYLQCVDLAKSMHQKILHQNFVSWDIAIEENGQPIFLEANFYGSAIVNQIALERPLFGDLTDEILYTAYRENNYNTVTEYSRIRDKFNINRVKLSECRERNRNLRARHKKTKNRLDITRTKLQKQGRNKIQKIESLESKVTSLEREVDRMKDSRSWRYTSFLRKKER